MRVPMTWLLTSASVLLAHGATGAEGSGQDRACDAHAAAMVAEMQASSATPLSAEERTLVRRTAHKSCIAQAAQPHPGEKTAVRLAPVEPAAAKPAPAPAPAPASASESARDHGFWSAFEPLIRGGTERSDGNKRLRRRGRY